MPASQVEEGFDAKRMYEVFLSFRGEDTRASFTSHLHASLLNAGITVFRDDDSLRRGDHISTALLQAIEESQISIVVFSRNYADSRSCMEELKKIMECRSTIGQVVLPVFYDVDPSEVRRQKGEFGKAFQNLLDRNPKKRRYDGFGKTIRKLLNSVSDDNDKEWLNLGESWREALRQAGSLVGVVVPNSRYFHN